MEEGALYCMRCSAILSTEGPIRVEEQEEELIRVVRKLVDLDPDLVERVVRETGAILELEGLKAGVI